MSQSAPTANPEQPASQTPDLPRGWKDKHTRFIRDLAKENEDAASIKILFETEFPGVDLEHGEKLEDVVRKIMAET
ncbi:hypothetical protein PMZ80_003304 [Knufia obscura]|uniref:Uncharacterized protein n=2 Tax=Knufia TaxID=430999 RepID=A0AAN8IJP6_9EURO|nr:hypothetical protein PMZ80_003304 [Knufia obscura]KAK5950422.1 hypothetical protein OHC33_008641 [Knufia fluminis]